LKLNHYRIYTAFKEKDQAEIVRILVDEFADTRIEGLKVIVFKHSFGYIECNINGYVHEWYPEDGFTTRSSDGYDPPEEHIVIAFGGK